MSTLLDMQLFNETFRAVLADLCAYGAAPDKAMYTARLAATQAIYSMDRAALTKPVYTFPDDPIIEPDDTWNAGY